jgi:hypothetical protein
MRRVVISAVRTETLEAGEHCDINYSRVEAGSNTSIVALRVVRGDKMESLKSETVKYGRKSHGTRTLE